MADTQFRVLYRQFLFRVVDLEILSSEGEASRLLGQFAALLVFSGLVFSIGIWSMADARISTSQHQLARRGFEHFLIATTMLVVGLFAVLCWDSILPDQRDVLVLAPLPIRASTIFLAKVSAVATGLAVTVAALNALSCLPAPLAFAPLNCGLLGLPQSFVAYWIAMFAAGTFIFCCVLGVQATAGLVLPRQPFLRLSSFLQIGAFCLFVCLYFLEPSLAAANHYWLTYSPSYWFLGLFDQLNGSMQPAFAPLAIRAWLGLAVAGVTVAVLYPLSYFRMLFRIAEQPDVVPHFVRLNWLPPLGGALKTAVGHFSIRTLLRSRKHRLILAFYWGLGFALTILFVKMLPPQQETGMAATINMWRRPNTELLVASAMMLFSVVLGTRIAFAMPIDLPANWSYRITPLAGLPEYMAATRRAMLLLAVAPVWMGWATIFLWLWGWGRGWGELLVFALLGVITAEITLAGFHKIPFTCSYLPGKSKINITFWLCIGFLGLIVDQGAILELHALQRPVSYAAMIALLLVATILARKRTALVAASESLRFEELPAPAVLHLGLHHD